MKLAKFAFVCAAAAALTAVADDPDYTSSELAILPVAKTLNAMPLAVSFTESDGQPLSATKIVKTANLPDGSALYVYDKQHSKYTKYVLNNDKTDWTLANDGKTYIINANGQVEEGEGEQAAANPVARGAAVFLETPSDANPTPTFYMAGKPASGTITTTLYPGANLVGAPTGTEVNLNTLTYSNISNSTITAGRLISTGDVIEYASGNGGLRVRYYYNGEHWGKIVTSGSGFTNTSVFDDTTITIPAGQGFWYIRAGSENASITW